MPNENEIPEEVVETTETVEETKTDTIEELKKQLEETTRHAKNKEQEAARNKKRLDALEKIEADRKLAELSEIEKANVLLSDEQKKRQEAEDKLNTLHLEKNFEKSSKSLQFEYANEQAEKDAFAYLTSKGVTTETMDEMLKSLSQERPYLMKTKVEKPEIDSKEKGMKLQGEMTEARRKELTQRIPSLR